MFAAALAVPAAAHADPNDLALGRLSWYGNPDPASPSPAIVGPGCGMAGSNFAPCNSNNDAFINLMNQLGGALAPGLMAPAGTIGYNHLYVGYEGAITNIESQTGGPWSRGTEGGASGQGIPGALYVSRLHIRKGFPLGFEMGLQGSFLHDSSMVALGVDVRWAPFEGFRRDWGQYVPDLAFRGAVNTLAANAQAYLTVVTVDGSISKPITLGGSVVLTPYLGAMAMMIFGDSSVVDATPTRSSFGECSRREVVNFTGDDGLPASRLECRSGVDTPMGAQNDSQNELVFTAARLLRWRGFLGARARFGIFTVTAEFGFDASDPSYLSTPAQGTRVPQTRGEVASNEMPNYPTFSAFRQYSGNIGFGVTF